MPPLKAPSGEIEAKMLLDRLFRPRPALTAGRALYAAEDTPLAVFGLSHFLVVEKTLAKHNDLLPPV